MKAMSHPKSKRRFQFQALEDRLTRAGDIAASLQGGNLYITEAAAQVGQDNGILISETSKGTIRIQGTAASGTGAASLVNGAAFRDFVVPGSLFVSLGAGNDKVEFSSLGPTIKLQSVDLNVGPVSVATGVSDKDSVSVANLQTSAGLSIETGADDDTVYIGACQIGDYVGNDQLYIKTGAGADFVSLQGGSVAGSAFIQTYDALTENDVDTVYVDKNFVFHADANFSLGGGNDNVYLGDASGSQGYEYSVEILDSLTLDTGTGDDTVSIYNASIGWSATNTTNILTGAGADQVTINGPHTDLMNLNLLTYSYTSELDKDVVHIQSVTLGGSSAVRMGGGDDQFTSDVSDPSQPAAGTVIVGSLYVDMGAGNDTVNISALSDNINSSDTLTIHTGAGVDTVNVSSTHDLRNLTIYTYDSLSESDADSVTISDVYAHGAITVLLGGGNDYFFLTGGTYSFTNIFVDAGTGNDRGYVYHAAAYLNFAINMGDGDDNLTVDSVFAHDLSLNGGNGFDKLGITPNISAIDAVFESGWEQYNHFNSWQDAMRASAVINQNIGLSRV